MKFGLEALEIAVIGGRKLKIFHFDKSLPVHLWSLRERATGFDDQDHLIRSKTKLRQHPGQEAVNNH